MSILITHNSKLCIVHHAHNFRAIQRYSAINRSLIYFCLLICILISEIALELVQLPGLLGILARALASASCSVRDSARLLAEEAGSVRLLARQLPPWACSVRLLVRLHWQVLPVVRFGIRHQIRTERGTLVRSTASRTLPDLSPQQYEVL
jgi:hypothetical protein